MFTLCITISCMNNPIIGDPPIENTLPAEFSALFNIFDGQGIGAATNINDDIMLFISSDGREYAWFEDNEIKKVGRVDDADGLFGGLAFSEIGAMIDFEEERLIAFNANGSTYQWIDIDPLQVPGGSENNSLLSFDGIFNLTQWSVDFSCPFENVGAIFGFSKEPEGCLMEEDDDLYLWMANDDGDEVVRYVKEGQGSFDEEVDLDEWRSNAVCGGSPVAFPLDGLGAACVYDPDGGIYQELFFSSNGTQMVILTPSTGNYSEVHQLR